MAGGAFSSPEPKAIQLILAHSGDNPPNWPSPGCDPGISNPGAPPRIFGVGEKPWGTAISSGSIPSGDGPRKASGNRLSFMVNGRIWCRNRGSSKAGLSFIRF